MRERILNIAIFLFLALSTYTTKVGVGLMWQSDDWITRSLVSWGLAIATSLVLWYISLTIVDSIKNKKLIRILIGYLMIASLSVFFNFNAFYSHQIKKTSLTSEVTEIRDQVIKISSLGNRQIDAEYFIKQQVVDSLKAEMISEQDHPDRPGKGGIFHNIRREFEVGKTQLQTKKIESDKTKKRIRIIKDRIVGSIDSILDSGKEAELSSVVDEAISKYSEIRGLIRESTGEEIGIDLKKNTDVDKPDFALSTLIEFFFGDREFTSEENSKIILSMILSVILDFPVFFLIVILNLPTKKRRKKNNPFGGNEIDSRSSNPMKNDNVWGKTIDEKVNNTQEKDSSPTSWE